MTTRHSDFELVAGDDWEFDITVLDENNNAFDLTLATIMWALMNSRYERVLDSADATITKPNPSAGKCIVQIPAAKSTIVGPGIYTDTLRIVISGVTSTVLCGRINIVVDPWRIAGGYQFA